jgi:ATP-dependent helicase HrpB
MQAEEQRLALPVESVLEPLSAALRDAGAAVLCAPPGSGKTTRVPLALMDAPWLGGRRIVMLEPRRVAARAAARWMAGLLGEPVGERVGFRVRFDSAVSARTRVEVVTEGLLARRLQLDPELQGVGLLIFDEFHERNLHADLALALALDARRGLREDLRVLVMSATLDAQPIARLLGDAPVLHTAGRVHPVAVRYLDRPERAPHGAGVGAAIRTALREGDGDVLAFLPGVREIRAAAEQLARHPDTREVIVCPLYGDLPAAAQDRAIRADPQRRRRVVLATDIAQTSLTIEGVCAVVDSGLARRPRFDPNSELSRLHTLPISRASADQRAGRAGRLGPGLALRLWTEAEHAQRAAHERAEILDADLAALALELARWGVSGADALAWLDAPPAAALAQARELLGVLGALDVRGRITPLGHAMAALPTHPRLACMLVRADGDAERALAADVAAVLDGPDPLGGEAARVQGCDLRPRLALMARHGAASRDAPAASRGLAQTRRIAAQLRRASGAGDRAAADPEGAGRLLLCGFPDRLARRRAGARGRFLLAGGRGLRLGEHDPLAGSDWLVAADLDAGAVEARAYRAAALVEADVRAVLGDRLGWTRRVAWNEREQAVEAVEEERFGALVLRSRGARQVDAQQRIDAMLDGIRRLGLEALPWDAPSRQFCARVQSLAHWQPQAGWPAMHDAALLAELDAWLGPFLPGIGRREHLARLDLAAALRARVPPALLPRLDADAPTHLQVPGGSRLALEYRPGEAPVLAVKLQEMFGTNRTPAVCQGRVPVLLHLLSPARRPLHVTQDLDSFWHNAYPQVRKEMRGRYPKHAWPQDPLAAAPTPHTRRRR